MILMILAGLVVFFRALGRFSRAEPMRVAGLVRKIGGLAAAAFGAFLCLRGEIYIGGPLVMFGLGLMGFVKLQAGWSQRRGGPAGPSPSRASMSRAQALQTLGLDGDASEADIKAAHRRLMKEHHPDKGGDVERAARINAAKELLLG
jgi:hypothetical protein